MTIDFDYRGLGKLLAGRIDATGRGYRANCSEIGISIASVTHLKHGQPVAAHTVLRACAWLGVDIFDFAMSCESPPGSRAHGDGRFTCHTVKQQEKQRPGGARCRETIAQVPSGKTKSSGGIGRIVASLKAQEEGGKRA